MNAHSIYIHIPFCRHRCAYCDFNTYAGQERLIPYYIAALLLEIESLTDFNTERFPVHTLYFGGGTPSLLSISQYDQILRKVSDCFDLAADTEISIEANPGTLTAEYLQGLRAVGVNRLSLGVQSAHPQELAFLERKHQFEDVISAVQWARQAGFENLSLDLIFGLPEQKIETWSDSLDLTLGLTPEHFSLYALTIEDGTPLGAWVDKGLITIPDPDLAAEMYALAQKQLSAAGYLQYEISNWARAGAEERRMKAALSTPALACRHNLQYWRNWPYIGLGAGAHGFTGGVRTSNVLIPGAYIHHLLQHSSSRSFPRTPATVSFQPVDRQLEMGETMMMGLRLTREGVSRSAFQARFGEDFYAIYAVSIDRFVALGLLEWEGAGADILRLTPRGYLLGNQVFREFV